MDEVKAMSDFLFYGFLGACFGLVWVGLEKAMEKAADKALEKRDRRV